MGVPTPGIVVSVGLWRPLLAMKAVTLVQNDTSAALVVARRLAPRSPTMNSPQPSLV